MDLRSKELRSTDRLDSVVMEVQDSITITITKTITENEAGDTIRMNTVVERDRVRNRDAIAKQQTKTEMIRDTVYIERKDSVRVQGFNGSGVQGTRASPWIQALKWVFWTIIAIGVVIVVIKASKVFKFFI